MDTGIPIAMEACPCGFSAANNAQPPINCQENKMNRLPNKMLAVAACLGLAAICASAQAATYSFSQTRAIAPSCHEAE